jgi:hypothetical protein
MSHLAGNRYHHFTIYPRQRDARRETLADLLSRLAADANEDEHFILVVPLTCGTKY